MKLFPCGATPDGVIVVEGVYGFYETHGLPLSDIINTLWRGNRMVPSWLNLARDMVRSGRSPDRAIESVLAAVEDAACFDAAFVDRVRLVMGSAVFLHAVSNP